MVKLPKIADPQALKIKMQERTKRLKERMVAQQEALKLKAEFQKRHRKMAEMEILHGEVERADEPQTLDDMNAAIDGLDGKKKSKNRLSGAELEQWKADRDRNKRIRLRQGDMGHSVTLVFPSTGVANAFVAALMERYIVGREGDQFIDGRDIAAALKIDLPSPEYEMTTNVTLGKGRSLTMEKIPRGYVSP